MGFEIMQCREEFPVTRHLTYLNHAAVAPLSQRAASAMKTLADDACQFGSLHYDKWLDAYEGLRVATAKMIGAHRDEIAHVKNTSEGIATVAMGLNWRSGDKIVLFRDEFPANQFPWQRLESKGVEIVWLEVMDPLDRIEAAVRGARLLAISFVQYLTGYMADIKGIGEICRRHGCFYFVDAIQGLGAFSLNVEECNIDALAADGHKWMLGPEGMGILYVRRDRLDDVEPMEFGWTNVASFNDYSSRDMQLRPDAGRYEPGTLNTIGCFGLRASIELLLEVGIENIGPAVRALAIQIEQGVREKGYEVLGTPGAGIVSFRKPDVDSRLTVRQLKENRIIAAPRQGWVRVSPHFYISHDDVQGFLECL
jgi:cysteine desulfurase / selenocysteine lyase